MIIRYLVRKDATERTPSVAMHIKEEPIRAGDDSSHDSSSFGDVRLPASSLASPLMNILITRPIHIHVNSLSVT